MKVLITNLCILLCAALLMQGFQCKSSEMTTASIAMNNKDWDKAEMYLEKELQKNPTNGAAWFDLGQVRYEKQNYMGMLDAFKEARKYIQQPDKLNQMSFQESKVWVDSFNGAVQLYNEGIALTGNEKVKTMRAAIGKMEFAVSLRPFYTESYSVLAQMHESVGDTAKSITTLEHYVDAQRGVVDVLVRHNVMLGSKREAVQGVLGNASSVKGTTSGKDSVLLDHYKNLDGKDVYLFYKQEGGDFVLDGGHANLPATLPDADKERPSALNTQNYSYLAFLYYNNGQYDKAMELLRTVMLLRPATEDMLRLQGQILDKTGKREEAMKSIAELAKKYPDNKAYLVQYGSVLVNTGKNDEAIEQFEKALKLDSRYDIALYNLAAAYKNKAGVIQQEEKEKMDADAKYRENQSRYVPFLEKAATYFEQYRALPGKDKDFGVVEQLMNIYQVTRNEQKIKRFAAELSGLEPLYQTNRAYYELLGRIYGKLGNTDKAKEAFEKADKLR